MKFKFQGAFSILAERCITFCVQDPSGALGASWVCPGLKIAIGVSRWGHEIAGFY